MTPTPKHIIIVTHHYPPHITGVGFVAQNQAQQLAALGNKVTVITSNTGPDEKSYCAKGVNVIRVKAWNISEKWSAPFPLFAPSLLPILFSYISQADIVHVHDAFYMSSFFATLIAKFYRKPVVMTQHVAMIAHPSRFIVAIQQIVYATTGALIFRLSNSILVYNDIVKEFLISKRHINPAKILELRNGVDHTIFHTATLNEKRTLREYFKLPTDKPLVLFVGRLVPKKGFLKLLEARDADFDLVFAGPGKVTAAQSKMAGVHFMGSMSQIELAKLYRTADLFVFPAEGEMFTLAMQEAMASGLPVITTDEKEYQKYDLDRSLISFIKPTPALLQKNIKSLIADKTLQKKMSAYSVALAKEWFDTEVNSKNILNLYSHLVEKRKKIAIISDSISLFNKGGKEKRIESISTRLAQQGFDVTIYCMKWWKGEKTMIKDGITFHAISPLYPLYAGNRRSISQAIFYALNCLKLLTKDFDIVDVDHMPHLVLFTMKIVCVLKGKNMIVTWHEVWGKEYWKKYLGTAGIFAFWVEKISVMLPDVIISVSEHTTAALRTTLGSKKPIITVPNGLDFDEVTKNIPAQSGADIIFAGRLLSHKNIDVLLRATKILVQRKPNLSVLIIGEGPEKNGLMNLMHDLNLEKNVTFKDFFEDYHEVYRIMLASKIFALPSTREGFGIVALEANACGLPVVTIDHADNAAKELIIDGKNGILTSLDEQKMAEALEKALSMKIGRTEYLPYIEKYNWNTITTAIINVYEHTNA